MFCRGDEGLPLPPEDEALEARAGSELVFKFGGRGSAQGRAQRTGARTRPLYSDAERIDEEAETWSGPGGTRFVEPETFPGRHVRDLGARRVGASPAGTDSSSRRRCPWGVRRPPGRQGAGPRGDSPRPYSISPSASFPAGL